jgi:hypothetical protein
MRPLGSRVKNDHDVTRALTLRSSRWTRRLSVTAGRPIPLVFVDTNVFHPVRLADLVLSCVGDGLFNL